MIFDFIWKFLFFSTILSSSYFFIVLISGKVFKFYSAAKKAIALKAAAAFVVLSMVLVSFYLLFSDRDIVADCFGKFASKEGVFGMTRILAAIWLIGVFFFIIKDFIGYRTAMNRLRSSALQPKMLKVNGQNIGYIEIENPFEPVAAGLIRPQIFIPQVLSRNKKALRQILCHELVHIQNNDGLWSFANVLIHRLNWHNPITLFSFDKIKVQIEMATDELAVSKFNLQISEYAEQLVGLVAQKANESLFMMNISGEFLQIQSRLLNLKHMQSGKVRHRSYFSATLFFIFALGLSEAYAAIAQKIPLAYQSQMCFQVNHELMIESWMMEKNKSESNKCE